jgi:stage II sporulation protein AA (anti-sigma F factor antagonist)
MAAQTVGVVRGTGPLAGLRVTELEREGVREFAVEGDLDLAGAPGLCLRLDAARHAPGRRVLLDLSGVGFCDSTGLRALVGAARELAVAACGFAVVVPLESAVGRLLTLTGLWEFLPAREDRPGALRTLGVRAD